MTAPTPNDLKEAGVLIHNLVNRWSLAMISQKVTYDLDALEEAAGQVIDGISKMKDLTTIKTAMPSMSNANRDVSLRGGILRTARDLLGGQVFTQDQFKDRIEQAVDAADREFWMDQTAGLLLTLIREKPEIASVLEDEGVLVWSEDDRLVRVVNTRWLTDHEDIFAFVTSEPATGKRCRFCEGMEGPHSFALQPLDPNRRNKAALLGSMSGRPVQIFSQSTVYCHPQCAPFWMQWVQIAERFAEAA